MRDGPFRGDDHLLLVDRRGRRYLAQLSEGGRFSSHLGHFEHDDVIGLAEGAWIETSRGHLLLAIRPTMADYTRLMPRTATVVYPKDLGGIIISGDIFPGATVLEAGCGSGAVTIALMRAVGPGGFVHSFDLRQDMVDRASENVRSLAGPLQNVSIGTGDVADAMDEMARAGTPVDRVVLDLPEPWDLVPRAADVLKPGGVLVSFLPTVLQVRDLVESLKLSRRFAVVETTESMVRGWNVANRSVRPDHRMVGHTGFITSARLCEPRPPSATAD